MDEVLLIQECLKGKRKAQGELYRRYAAKMMGVCMRYSATGIWHTICYRKVL